MDKEEPQLRFDVTEVYRPKWIPKRPFDRTLSDDPRHRPPRHDALAPPTIAPPTDNFEPILTKDLILDVLPRASCPNAENLDPILAFERVEIVLPSSKFCITDILSTELAATKPIHDIPEADRTNDRIDTEDESCSCENTDRFELYTALLRMDSPLPIHSWEKTEIEPPIVDLAARTLKEDPSLRHPIMLIRPDASIRPERILKEEPNTNSLKTLREPPIFTRPIALKVEPILIAFLILQDDPSISAPWTLHRSATRAQLRSENEEPIIK
jgi:hypothetical protein